MRTLENFKRGGRRRRMEVSKEMIVVLLTFIFLLLIKIESVTCSEERDVRFVKESRSDFDNDVRRIPLLRPPEVASPKKMSEEESQSVGVEFWRSVDTNERNDDIRGSVSDLVRNSSNSASDNLKKDRRPEDFQENNSTVEDSRENSRFLVTRLAQCRATCLAKRNLKLKKIERSLKTAALVNIQDIQIAFEHCWDTCMRLESHKKKTIKEMSRTLMCKTATNCLSDCCEFHQEDLSENNKTSFAGVKVEPILSIAISGLEKADKKKKKKLIQLDLAWPGPSDEDEPVVYSVIQHVVVRVNSTPTWRLLAQTIKWNISLTLAVKGEKSDIRVLATSPTRLVRVFSVKVGAGNGISDDDHDDDDDVVVKGEPIRSPQPSVNASALQESRQRDEEHNVEEDWHLCKLSMIHRNFLVLTQITWNSRVYGKAGASATGPNISAPIQPKGQPSSVSGAAAVSDQSVKDTKRKFLLTWQEEGGLLKGNMVTDTNSVSISLLPNTQYLIQVGLIESDAGAKAAAEEDESNPWDSPVQPNVSKWSPLLKVNTSEAPEAISGKSNSNSSQAQEGESKTESSTSEGHNVDHLPHHLQTSLISSKRDELSGHRRLRHPSSGKLKEDHHHESERTLFGVTCECSGGKIGTKWCCQTLIVSFVLVLAGIYGLLILLSCLFYIFFYFFKLSPHQLAKDFVFYCSRSSLKLKLVEHAEDNDDQDGDHVQPDFDNSLRKGLGKLSQYNIV